MNYDFSTFKKKAKDIEEWLKKEQGQIRTGRATPTLLDGISAEVYGSPMSLIQLGSMNTEDARTLRLTLWDMSAVKAVEKAINDADLGVSVSVDDKGIRVSFPQLTTERRALLIKLSKEKLELARISVRKLRDETQKDILEQEKLGGMGEDDRNRFKTELEKQVQETNKNLEVLSAKKEEEINS